MALACGGSRQEAKTGITCIGCTCPSPIPPFQNIGTLWYDNFQKLSKNDDSADLKFAKQYILRIF